jgi:hypothetical protein
MKTIDLKVEIGEGLLFEITKEVNGFLVSYDAELFEGWKPSTTDLKWLIQQIKKIMKELNIQIPNFALELAPFGGLTVYNPTCFADKRKEVIYLCLPITVIRAELAIPSENQEDYIYYHELMHAKDTLEGRFPSGGFIDPSKNPELALITSLWHFSIEGRLEKNGKPHLNKEESVEQEYFWASKLEKSQFIRVEKGRWERQVQPWALKKLITKEFIKELCDKLWGKEVTFKELQLLVNGISR